MSELSCRSKFRRKFAVWIVLDPFSHLQWLCVDHLKLQILLLLRHWQRLRLQLL